MYFPPFDYEPENMVYLGSSRNSHTNMPYDFWYINNESVTARHGVEDWDYGSSRLTDMDVTFSASFDYTKDYVWGMMQARLAVLYYLATKKKPLVPHPERKEFDQRMDPELYTYSEEVK